MTRAAEYGLSGLMIALGLLIVLEMRGGARTRLTDAAPAPAVPAPTGKPVDTTGTSVATILARPLFDPSRAPPAEKSLPMAAAPLPRLAGIMVTPREKDAVFVLAGGPTIVAPEGGRAGAYTVQAIGRQTVTVAGPGGVTILHTRFASGVATSPAAAPAAPFSIILPPNIIGITGTPGGVWLDNGKADLPDAASVPGPPQIAGPQAPAAAPPPAAPILAPPG